MRSFAALMQVREGMSILDFRGQPMIWESVPEQLNLTIVNLPGIAELNVPSHHAIRYIEGDACVVGEVSRIVRTGCLRENDVGEGVDSAEHE